MAEQLAAAKQKLQSVQRDEINKKVQSMSDQQKIQL